MVAHQAGADLAVLPEMFNTGYGLLTVYDRYAEPVDGPTMMHLRRRSREWGMVIAAGFVERDGPSIYNAMGLCLPDGSISVYRKRHLVLWERSQFQPGREPLVVTTRWGRVGLAICADMIYEQVWCGYRGQLDLVAIAAAWPNYADRNTSRTHWLVGKLGLQPSTIPVKICNDLHIPVIFSNQCGQTSTRIPLVGIQIDDRFAGLSSVCDGCHGLLIRAGDEEEVVLSTVNVGAFRRIPQTRVRRPSPEPESGWATGRTLHGRLPALPWNDHGAFYISLGLRGVLYRIGMLLFDLTGSWTYWQAIRRRRGWGLKS